jgi:hypothetical protein
LIKLRYVKSPKDLVTPIDVTQAGFLQQALRKNREANPYLQRAKYLLNKLQPVKKPQELINMKDIRDDLVTAAGFSDKATNYFSPSELEDALLEVLQDIEKKVGSNWQTEIVYRFLLTRGDTLGGVMRNILGSEAKDKFTDAILTALREGGIQPRIGYSKKGKVQQISWPGRILLLDKQSKLIGKNVDVILLRQDDERLPVRLLLGDEAKYIACGEVKGGIDPAGADEHWKTAYGALARIREKFRENQPQLFFIDAAIENSMAIEIFSQLQSGMLSHAANLNVSRQVSDLASWLVSF